MTKKVLVLLAEGFEEIEAVTVIDVLRRAGIKTVSAGIDKKLVKGSRGIIIETDCCLLSNAPLDFDAIALPGGTKGAQNLAASKIVNDLILKTNKENKLICAICAAPALVLAPLGILNNKSATCYPEMEENFDKTTKHQAKNVVIDENIITSRGPSTAMEFALTIVETLCGKEIKDKVKNGLLV